MHLMRPSFRYLLLFLGIAVGVAVVGLAAGRYRGYYPPAAAGAQEEAARQLMLSDAPLERRLSGLFDYFAQGFVRHTAASYSRVQFAGAGSYNGAAMDGLEGFARTGGLLAAWVYSGRPGSDVW